jgi:hypothetical protein
LHLNFHTVTSEQYFSNFFIENFQRHTFLASFVMQDWPLPGRIGERKFLPQFYCLPLKWIWQQVVWSLHTILAVQHCSWFYFMMCHPWWWWLNKYIFMGIG